MTQYWMSYVELQSRWAPEIKYSMFVKSFFVSHFNWNLMKLVFVCLHVHQHPTCISLSLLYGQRRTSSVTRWPDCFFIWPFTMMKFCPKANKKTQSWFTTLPNINLTFEMFPKISNFLLNWRIFAKLVTLRTSQLTHSHSDSASRTLRCAHLTLDYDDYVVCCKPTTLSCAILHWKVQNAVCEKVAYPRALCVVVQEWFCTSCKTASCTRARAQKDKMHTSKQNIRTGILKPLIFPFSPFGETEKTPNGKFCDLEVETRD